MTKKELLKLKKLTATKVMLKQALSDSPIKKHLYYQTVDSYECGIYYRCQVMNGILKVAIFLARDLRLGNRNPVYEVFLDRAANKFLTWDVVHKKWRSAKLDMLEWPDYIHHSGYYSNKVMDDKIMKYLGVTCGGYKGILKFQQRVRCKASLYITQRRCSRCKLESPIT